MNELRLVRQLQNNLQPVNKLPPELLCFIFEFAHGRNGVADPLAISSVCEQWREVALSLPSLWTNIAISTTQYDSILEYIQRSEGSNSQLDVSIRLPQYMGTLKFPYGEEDPIEGPFPALLKGLELIAGVSDRIRSIEVEARHIDSAASCQWELLDFRVPNLVHFGYRGGSRPEGWYQDAYTPPETIFGGILPRLKSVSLCDFYHGFRHLRNITTLRLSTNWLGMSWDVFWDILDSSPLLESLYVERCRFRDFSPSYYHLPGQISLNSLTHLTLVNSATREIVKELITPQLVQLVIWLSPETIPLGGSLVGHLNPLLALESLSIEVAQPETKNQELTLTVKGTTGTLIFSQTMMIHYYHFGTLCFPSLYKIKTLKIGVGFHSFRPSTATGLSSAMASLRRLTVVGGQWESILCSLFSKNGALVCPELEEITVFLTPDIYRAIFSIVRNIVTSRAAELGRVVRIGYVPSSECGDDVRMEWEGLCLTAGILTFCKDATSMSREQYLSA